MSVEPGAEWPKVMYRIGHVGNRVDEVKDILLGGDGPVEFVDHSCPECGESDSAGGSVTAGDWSIRFTNDELEAIYTVIEDVPPLDGHEEALERVIHKITPSKVGDPTPAGAARSVDPLQARVRELEDLLIEASRQDFGNPGWRQRVRAALSPGSLQGEKDE